MKYQRGHKSIERKALSTGPKPKPYPSLVLMPGPAADLVLNTPCELGGGESREAVCRVSRIGCRVR